MPLFSKASKSRLEQCHAHLVILFHEVIKHYDCAVIYGHRTPEEQFILYQKGRALVGGKWQIYNKNLVVTNCDGYEMLSPHNCKPATAVDVAPCINGKITYDEKQCYHFCGFVRGISIALDVHIRGGHDWNKNNDVLDQKFNDLLHWEVV